MESKINMYTIYLGDDGLYSYLLFLNKTFKESYGDRALVVKVYDTK